MKCRPLPLFVALAVAWLNGAPVALAQETKLTLGGTGTTLGIMQPLAVAFELANPGVSINVLPSIGSAGGLKALIAGTINIALSARPPTDDERSQGAVAAIEYGRSPLVLAVHRSLAVTGITKAQLLDIYTGKMNRWPDGTPLRLILRPPLDSNTIVLQSMSRQMKDAVAAAAKRSGIQVAMTDQDTTAMIRKIPGSVGPASLAELITANPPLKALALDGVAPSAASIADGSYPIYHRFYLVTRAKPGALAERFIAFVRSEAGVRILTETGHWVPNRP